LKGGVQMTAKEYLAQAYRIDKRINSKLEQISSYRDLANKVTSIISDIPHSSTRDISSIENVICKIIDLENEVNDDIDYLVELKRSMVFMIKQIKNPEHQTLLELRYLCYHSWEKIAVEMDYSLQHIFRLHNSALKDVVIPKR
jgi:DNA-directed RNA polymerase specialized sigma subunit